MNAELNVPPDSARDVAGEQDTTDPLADFGPGAIEGLQRLADEYGPRGVVNLALILWPDLAAVVRASGTTAADPRASECRCSRLQTPHYTHTGSDAYVDPGASNAEIVRAAQAVSGVTPGNPTREPRHFAPYGSTNALCDETVPRRVAWDEREGEYANQRFTTRRDRTTCRECLRLMHPDDRPSPAPGDQQAEIERRAALAAQIDALTDSGGLTPAGRADMRQRYGLDPVPETAPVYEREFGGYRGARHDERPALSPDGHPAPDTQDGQA